MSDQMVKPQALAQYAEDQLVTKPAIPGFEFPFSGG
jgi:hypothetical protein